MHASVMSIFSAVLIIFAVSVLDSAAQDSSTVSSTQSSTDSSTESSTSTSSTSGSTSTTKSGSTSKTTSTKKPTTTKTTTAKPPNCAAGNFKGMLSAKTPCCSPPPSPLVSFNKTDTVDNKYCSASDGAMAPFSSFSLNKLQSTKSGKNNTFALNDTATIKTILKEACFVDCYLSRKNASINGTLVPEVIVPLFSANQSESWTNIIQMLISECTDLVAGLELPSQTNPVKNKPPCYLTGYLVTQCVLFGAIGSCPTESRVISKTGSCNTLWPTFEKCSAQLLASIGYTETAEASAPLKNNERVAKQTILRRLARKSILG